MKKENSISKLLSQTDIYLIDQIMKGRYQENEKILDAGCGSGRNMHWFRQNNFEVYAIDTNNEIISQLRSANAAIPKENFLVSSVDKTPFRNNYFDHIVCIAVLHFATNKTHFKKMFGELVRIVKPGGSLLFRIAADIGFEDKIHLIGDGVYKLPDGTDRFLLTKELLAECMQENNLSFLEPFKTVNVDDLRCMSTLVLRKN